MMEAIFGDRFRQRKAQGGMTVVPPEKAGRRLRRIRPEEGRAVSGFRLPAVR